MKKKAKKKAKKEKFKKARMESLANNEKWEATIQARAAGASSSRDPTTVRPGAPDGEKTIDNTATGSETHKPHG